MLTDAQTGEPEFAPIYQNQWRYQSDGSSALCAPVPPPENPLIITIDATVGIGNLKVHRV